MKRKHTVRTFAFVMCMLLQTCLFACGQAETTDHSEQIEDSKDTFVDSAADASSLVPDSTPQSGEEVLQKPVDVNPREISHYITGDIELDRAIELGFATKDDFSDPERLALGSDTIAASNHLVELASQEVYESFKGKYGVIKIYDKALTRFDGAVILYITATALGAEYTDSVDWPKIDEMMAGKNGADLNEKCFKLWNYSLFRELDEYPTINFGDPDINMDQMSSILTFISGHIDLRLGKRLLECEEGTTDLHFDDLMTYEDMIRAFVRLYDSDASNGYDSFDNMYFVEQERILTDSTSVRSSVRDHSYPVDEYERAIFYGFIEDGILADEAKETDVSWAGFCELLGKMIKLYDETKLPEWETLTGGLTSAAINRKGATVALLYAAETLGLNTVNTRSGDEYVSNPKNTGPDEEKGILDEMAPLVKTINPMYGEAYLNTPRLYVSYDYAIKRISCITYRSLLEGKWRPDDKLTLYEAALSAVRLYESSEEKAYETAEMILDKILETDEAKQIQTMADERRETIHNSTTDIVKSDKFIQGETYTGKAYYISQEGSDKNNGLSEETPWASPYMLAKINLKFGDAVFFKRGETWYNEELSYLLRAQGITVSAYGTGDKPRFYGSLENSAGKEKWELSFETEEGIKIWKYYQAMPDASVIVMNGGEQYAVRSCPYWDGNEYHELTYNGLNEEPYDFRSALQDMEFFHDLRYTSSVENHGRVFETGYDRKGRATYLTGDLYLRCDAGNPGELFDDIQIPTPSCFISGLPSYTTIDNIEISYSGAGMATGHENGKNDHIYIQNCESSWMGGAIYNYYSDLFHQIRKMGGTFNVGCAGNVIRNNYAHHIYQEGPTFESFEGDDGMLEDVTIEGNLLEYCPMGSLITNWDKDVKESHIFKNFVYRNNMVLYSGFESFYNDRLCDLTETGSSGYYMEGDLVYDSRCIGIIGCPLGMNAHDGTLAIENNLFAFSFGKLIDISFFTDEYSKVFHGNTYAQLPGFCWLSAYRDGESFEKPRELDPVTAIEKIGDDSAAVIRFDE